MIVLKEKGSGAVIAAKKNKLLLRIPIDESLDQINLCLGKESTVIIDKQK